MLKLRQGQIFFSSNLRLPPNMSEPGKYKQLYKDSSFHEYYNVNYKRVGPTNIGFVEQLGQITGPVMAVSHKLADLPITLASYVLCVF